MNVAGYIWLTDAEASTTVKLSRWTLSHAALTLLFFLPLVGWGQSYMPLLFIGTALSMLRLLWVYPEELSRHSFKAHLANITTGLRVIMMLGLGLTFEQLPLWLITGIAVLSLCLDGLDGYFARKHHGESMWGAYLDKESDAYFVLLMVGILVHQGQIPFWIWSVALIRYFYVLGTAGIKPKNQREPRLKFGRWIAGILMGALCFALVLPPSWATLGMTIISILVFFSFGRSIYLNYSTWQAKAD